MIVTILSEMYGATVIPWLVAFSFAIRGPEVEARSREDGRPIEGVSDTDATRDHLAHGGGGAGAALPEIPACAVRGGSHKSKSHQMAFVEPFVGHLLARWPENSRKVTLRRGHGTTGTRHSMNALPCQHSMLHRSCSAPLG